MIGRIGPARERGIALLTAILLVALGTIIAASLGFRTVMTARRDAGAFALDESLLAAEATEALAAYALERSRAQNPADDALGQPWAMPFGPVEVAPGVTVEASLEDLQGRFNLNNLVDPSGNVVPRELDAFESLLQILGLETQWAPMIADWIDANGVPEMPDGAEDDTYLSQVPPYRTANREITSTSELLALPGFGAERYAKIAPYVTALPSETPLNLCTASGPVLDALGPPGVRQYSDLTVKQLASDRAHGCFPTLQEYQAGFGGQSGAAGPVSTLSSYFLLTSVVDIGSREFYLYSLLYRQGNGTFRVIERRFTPD